MRGALPRKPAFDDPPGCANVKEPAPQVTPSSSKLHSRAVGTFRLIITGRAVHRGPVVGLCSTERRLCRQGRSPDPSNRWTKYLLGAGGDSLAR